MIRIEVPMLPPRALTMNAPWSTHWSGRHAVRKTWREAVYFAGYNFRDAMIKRAHLKIICVARDRRYIMDNDNTLTACKAAIDMLTARIRGANPGRGDPGRQGLCIIEDDTPEVLTIKPVEWEIDYKRAPLTIFEIEEME